MKQFVKVSFYLKKTLSKENESCPVFGRLTIGKDVAQFSLKLNVPMNLWNTGAGRAKGKSKEACEINEKLDKIRLSANIHFKELSLIRDNVTAEQVKFNMLGMVGKNGKTDPMKTGQVDPQKLLV